jgi:hypothetical protein
VFLRLLRRAQSSNGRKHSKKFEDDCDNWHYTRVYIQALAGASLPELLKAAAFLAPVGVPAARLRIDCDLAIR